MNYEMKKSLFFPISYKENGRIIVIEMFSECVDPQRINGKIEKKG
jgi:hypothetical protein